MKRDGAAEVDRRASLSEQIINIIVYSSSIGDYVLFSYGIVSVYA